MSNKENKLVAKILSILKLDDAGQVEKYINKTIKDLDRDVVVYKRKIVNLEHNHTEDLDNQKEKLEDLEVTLEDSYTNVDVDAIKTNEGASEFRGLYLKRIRTAELNVKHTTLLINDLIKEHEEAVEEIQKDIDLRKLRIKKLKGL